MGPRNLLDGGYDKVIWICSRDLLTKHRENATPRRGGDIPQQSFWVFYLGPTTDVVETCQWDVVDTTYHWNALVTYHWDFVGYFI